MKINRTIHRPEIAKHPFSFQAWRLRRSLPTHPQRLRTLNRELARMPSPALHQGEIKNKAAQRKTFRWHPLSEKGAGRNDFIVASLYPDKQNNPPPTVPPSAACPDHSACRLAALPCSLAWALQDATLQCCNTLAARALPCSLQLAACSAACPTPATPSLTLTLRMPLQAPTGGCCSAAGCQGASCL